MFKEKIFQVKNIYGTYSLWTIFFFFFFYWAVIIAIIMQKKLKLIYLNVPHKMEDLKKKGSTV